MKVYILQWAASGKIDSIYLSREKAENIANKENTRVTWRYKLAGLFSGKLTKWIVIGYEVK